jgi:hypothetical protein
VNLAQENLILRHGYFWHSRPGTNINIQNFRSGMGCLALHQPGGAAWAEQNCAQVGPFKTGFGRVYLLLQEG